MFVTVFVTVGVVDVTVSVVFCCCYCHFDAAVVIPDIAVVKRS